MTDTSSGQPASDNVRKARLTEAVQQEVVAGGRVESQDDFNAVVRYREPTNRVQQLIFMVGTVGLWAFGTVIMYLINKFLKRIVPYEAYGQRFRGAVAYHTLNLILTLVTLGSCSSVSLIMYRASRPAVHTVALTVDDLGTVVRQQVG